MKALLLAGTMLMASPAFAQQAATATQSEEQALRTELRSARERIDALERRLQLLEEQSATSAAPARPSGAAPATAPEQVGQAPVDFDRSPEIAVLGDQGAVITRAGEITAELGLDYTRADRNRAVFRGIELVESVLIGVFDINESRQDVLGASVGLRYGLTDRLELGVRLPLIHRSDQSVITPIAGSTPDDQAASIDNSAKRTGIGDLEATLRYQLTRARPGSPFFVANLQLVAPTGSSPFDVNRDETGRASQAATGSGFWGVTPSVTAILPSDPVVLFGSLGYTRNFADDVDTIIPPVRILRVKPGDSINASAGIGIAFNPRVSLNLGYAHSYAFGTRTTTQLLDPPTGDDGIRSNQSRALQIGRLLFGVTYRLSNTASFNWGVEIGATEDAPDVRTSIRLPITLAR